MPTGLPNSQKGLLMTAASSPAPASHRISFTSLPLQDSSIWECLQYRAWKVHYTCTEHREQTPAKNGCLSGLSSFLPWRSMASSHISQDEGSHTDISHHPPPGTSHSSDTLLCSCLSHTRWPGWVLPRPRTGLSTLMSIREMSASCLSIFLIYSSQKILFFMELGQNQQTTASSPPKSPEHSTQRRHCNYVTWGHI